MASSPPVNLSKTIRFNPHFGRWTTLSSPYVHTHTHTLGRTLIAVELRLLAGETA